MGSNTKAGTLPTGNSINGDSTFHFDGIFRDVNDKNTREKLYAAQQQLTDNRWEDAKNQLRSIINDIQDGHDKRNIKLVLKEVELYEKRHIDTSIEPAKKVDWEDVCSREVEIYFEPYDELPQSIFTLKQWNSKYGQQRVMMGRRILSHQWIASKIRELHCSHITASMLLGLMVDYRVRDDGYVVYYHPLTAAEKKFIMQDIIQNRLKDMEIVYPYPPLVTEYKTEIVCPDQGWEVDESLVLTMGESEVILREYSAEFLKALNKEHLRMYDPGCSTGQFLWAMKQALPSSYTMGQDLSSQMAKYASKRVDEVHCGNAMVPKVADETSDVVFVRFINSEIPKAKDARKFIPPLSKTVKKGGHLVIFGHTPVLVSAADLLMEGNLTLEQCVGGDAKWDGIFQYYVCRKQ